MDKQILLIKGMHCRSCEILIEEELLKITGIKNVKVSHKKSTAEIHYEGTLDPAQVETAVQKAGYNLGQSNRDIISKNPADYKDLGISILIVLGLFFIAKRLGIYNLSFGSGKSLESLPIVFLIGLTAGISTCAALVGGLILGTSAKFAESNPQASALEKFKPQLYFNFGRVLSYIFFGAIIGYAGAVLQLSPLLLSVITVLVGLFMLLLGLQLTEIFPVLSGISFTLPTGVSKKLGIKNKKEQQYTHTNAAALGALTFFLPCGFTQAMQVYAVTTGSPMVGAITLGTFALGTAPGLLGIGGLSSVVKGKLAKIFFKSAGVVIISLAVFNIFNGVSLTGIPITGNLGTKNTKPNTLEISGENINGTQVIKMDQNSNGYTPNTFTTKVGIPVRWEVASNNSYTCASSLSVPKLNYRKILSPGQNIIEFTPKETGSINFSCSMGMFRGVFNVID